MAKKEKLGAHISGQYTRELEDTRDRVLQMGEQVARQLARVLGEIEQGKISPIDQYVEQDDQINNMEMAIDEECVQMLARRQPAARDLRMIITASKSARDLERIGDEVQRVATVMEHALRRKTDAHELRDVILPLGRMTQRLLTATLKCYARNNTRAAVRNMHIDDEEVDDEYTRILMHLTGLLKAGEHNITRILDLIWAARSLERIGDHCINICENVIYSDQGKDVRHTELDDIKGELGAD